MLITLRIALESELHPDSFFQNRQSRFVDVGIVFRTNLEAFIHKAVIDVAFVRGEARLVCVVVNIVVERVVRVEVDVKVIDDVVEEMLSILNASDVVCTVVMSHSIKCLKGLYSVHAAKIMIFSETAKHFHEKVVFLSNISSKNWYIQRK